MGTCPVIMNKRLLSANVEMNFDQCKGSYELNANGQVSIVALSGGISLDASSEPWHFEGQIKAEVSMDSVLKTVTGSWSPSSLINAIGNPKVVGEARAYSAYGEWASCDSSWVDTGNAIGVDGRLYWRTEALGFGAEVGGKVMFRRTPMPFSAPPTGCTDSNPTGYLISGSPASCSQLASYCHHPTHGSGIQAACPKSCGAPASCAEPSLYFTALVTGKYKLPWPLLLGEWQEGTKRVYPWTDSKSCSAKYYYMGKDGNDELYYKIY